MWAASAIADWWDEQQRTAKEELDRFVENNPDLFGVVVATALAPAMDIGSGTIDTLRFGQGQSDGSSNGADNEDLRLIGLIGPLGRVAKIVHTRANAKLSRLIVDSGDGTCSWVSGTQALRQTGVKAFAAVDDLARALGKKIAGFDGIALSSLGVSLRQVGARMGAIRSVTSLVEIDHMTPNDGAVTLFSVFGKRVERGVLRQVSRALYAYRDNDGRLRILDPGSNAEESAEVFDSLEEVAEKYALQVSWTIREAAVTENMFARFIDFSRTPVFALAVYAVAGMNRLENETVAQAFEVHKVIMQQGKDALEQRDPPYHSVLYGDHLSRIAQKHYGDLRKWPVIYEANRDLIGIDPGAIQVGQRLMIPVLPRVNGIRG
jgi:hypothetical protein